MDSRRGVYNFGVTENREAAPWADRLLAWAGDGAPSAVRGAQLRSLHIALVATVTFELTQFAAFRRVHGVVDVEGVFDREPVPAMLFLLPLALGLILVALIFNTRPVARRWAAVAAAGVMALTAIVLFPNTPNHYPLLSLVLLALALFDLDDVDEQPSALATVRWFFVVALFLSGVQKLLYGAYFGAEFFVFRMAGDPIFAQPFEAFMPTAELERIRGLGGMVEGAGPFRTGWMPLVWLSNLTWMAELALPVLLLIRRTRPWAMVATLLFFVGIEVAPREVFFGFIAVQLVLVFGRRDWNGLLMPLWLLALVILTVLRYVAPNLDFS